MSKNGFNIIEKDRFTPTVGVDIESLKGRELGIADREAWLCLADIHRSSVHAYSYHPFFVNVTTANDGLLSFLCLYCNLSSIVILLSMFAVCYCF